jgi:hypothetical protein
MITAEAAHELAMDLGKRRKKISDQLARIQASIIDACKDGKLQVHIVLPPLPEVTEVLHKSGYTTDYRCSKFYVEWRLYDKG